MNKLSFVALLIGIAVSAQAGTITSYTTGGGVYNGVAYGQSVTTPGGGPWENIGFNFINGQNDQAYARGGLYVFTSPYSGTPGALNSSAYLDFTTTIDNNVWKFSSLTLNPNATYFFYMDGIVPLGQAIKLVPSDVYGGGVISTNSPSGSYAPISGGDMLFVLSGDQSSQTPEPGTWGLMAGGAALVAMVRRRRA